MAEFIALQASIERVTGLMDETPKITDTPEVIEKYGDCFDPKRENWEPIRGDIEFKDVTFRYPDGGDNVLEPFSSLATTVSADTALAAASTSSSVASSRP